MKIFIFKRVYAGLQDLVSSWKKSNYGSTKEPHIVDWLDEPRTNVDLV